MDTQFGTDYCDAFKGKNLPESGLVLNAIRFDRLADCAAYGRKLKDIFAGKCDALLNVGAATYLLINPTQAAQDEAAKLNTTYDSYKADPNQFKNIGPLIA
tara:strand:- start:177358 stop:177660 length:303 start_codon:yes stop_codon:yes gene_type:complete